MKPEFDERDMQILDSRLLAWGARSEPRVGDFIEMLDGSVRRLTYKWADGIQTTVINQSGSFYFGEGYTSYSGGLDPSIPLGDIKPTDRGKLGECWFFHHDYHKAHNGVHFMLPCRVYQQT